MLDEVVVLPFANPDVDDAAQDLVFEIESQRSTLEAALRLTVSEPKESTQPGFFLGRAMQGDDKVREHLRTFEETFRKHYADEREISPRPRPDMQTENAK